jgi:hypothetical protein
METRVDSHALRDYQRASLQPQFPQIEGLCLQGLLPGEEEIAGGENCMVVGGYQESPLR